MSPVTPPEAVVRVRRLFDGSQIEPAGLDVRLDAVNALQASEGELLLEPLRQDDGSHYLQLRRMQDADRDYMQVEVRAGGETRHFVARTGDADLVRDAVTQWYADHEQLPELRRARLRVDEAGWDRCPQPPG